jgi:NIMA-interacting peptidyl-prolyl cis-trans isomerase 4
MAKSKDSKPAGGKGGGKADSKGDKSKKGGGKGGNSKAAATDSSDTKASKLKGMTINVRHILCEKFTKSEEAIGRLNNGEKFDTVAREMSEDKAKAGEF